MTNLTESEAREIVDRYKAQQQAPVPPSIEEIIPMLEFFRAQGFLAGLSSERERTKGLVEAVEQTLDFLEYHTFTIMEKQLTEALKAYKDSSGGKE